MNGKDKQPKNKKNKKYNKIRIITLGETSVGKTSIIKRYIDNIYEDYKTGTIGIEYFTKDLKLENEEYHIIFCDTAGQEKFNAISSNFIKNAEGILLMYDITNKNSFNKISSWMSNIKENQSENVPIILIGNKCDLEEKRQVSLEEGKKLAEEYNLNFMETSNLSGINVEEAVLTIINQIIDKRKEMIKDYEIIDKIELNNIKIEKKKGCC